VTRQPTLMLRSAVPRLQCLQKKAVPSTSNARGVQPTLIARLAMPWLECTLSKDKNLLLRGCAAHLDIAVGDAQAAVHAKQRQEPRLQTLNGSPCVL